MVSFSSHAQDTLSVMTFYNQADVYKKCIEREYHNINKHYKIGAKHGLIFIYDLTAPANRMVSEDDTVHIINNHIYHVVSPGVYTKVSILMIPKDGDLIFFEGLNCCKPIHSLEDALCWLSSHFSNIDHYVLKNIMNYKDFHPNVPIDPQGSTPKCELPCKSKVKIHRKSAHKSPKIIHVLKK